MERNDARDRFNIISFFPVRSTGRESVGFSLESRARARASAHLSPKDLRRRANRISCVLPYFMAEDEVCRRRS